MLKDTVAGESASIARGPMAVGFSRRLSPGRFHSHPNRRRYTCRCSAHRRTSKSTNQHSRVNPCLSKQNQVGLHFLDRWLSAGKQVGEVTATGVRTYFGKTAELLRAATTVSHLQAIIFTIVKYLVMLIALLCSSFSLFPASAVAHDGNAAVCPHVAGGLSSCGAAGDFHFGDRAWLHGTGWQR